MHSRLLVVRGGALGDFVLTLPVLEALKAGGQVADLCSGGDHGRLARASGLAGATSRLDDVGWGGLWSSGEPGPRADELRRYDCAVVLRPVDRLATIQQLEALGVGRTLVHDPRPPDDGSVHAADHLLAAIGSSQGRAVPRISLPGSLVERGLDRLEGLEDGNAPAVLLFPGAGSESKRWPLPNFLVLAAALSRRGLCPVIVSGPVEMERMGPALGRAARGIVPVLEVEDILELAGLSAAAGLVIGNDSGPAHLAASLGTPVVALFGPTDERIWAPRGEGPVRILRGDHRTGGWHPASMDTLAVEPVIAAAVELAVDRRSGRQ